MMEAAGKPRPARADLRDHRPPVPADQHDLSTPRHEAANSPLLDVAETLLMMPDLFGWLLTGRRAGRADRRLDDAAPRPRRRHLVGRALQRVGPPPVDPPRPDRAGDRARAAPQVAGRGAGDRPAVDRDRPGHPRHRQRRGRRADEGDAAREPARLVLPQLGDVVPPGRRGPPAGDQRGDPGGPTSPTKGGVDGTTRLLKNIMGLWLVQECKRTWARAGRDYSYED